MGRARPTKKGLQQRMLTVAETAERLGLKAGAVRAMCQDGRLPKAEQVIISGRVHWLIPRTSVTWLEHHYERRVGESGGVKWIKKWRHGNGSL